MERSKKKHQDIPPLTDDEIALQKQLLMLAGGRGVGRNQILNKDPIANLLVHLDPVRMYYITDRDFSHTFARYNKDLQELWMKIATLWWKEYNTSVNLDEIVTQLKAIGVKHIDYYRLILCNWLLQLKTAEQPIIYMLYIREQLAARLSIKKNAKNLKVFELLPPKGFYSMNNNISSAYDTITHDLPDFRDRVTYDQQRKGTAKTPISAFCFLYKILSVEGLWIDVELEQTAQQYFKNIEELENYKQILAKYRSKMQEIDKERKQWVDLYNFRIFDHRLVICDKMIKRIDKIGFVSVILGDYRYNSRYFIYISKRDLKFQMSCGVRNKLIDQIVLHFFGILPHPNRSEYEFDIPTFEQQVIIFYILLSNSYIDTHWEHDKKYLVREKINTLF